VATFAERATEYATAVVSGGVPACEYVRLACQRHLDDLERDFPYRFDEDAVHKVCAFVECLPHVKGVWARNNESLRLEDWQCFVLGISFGWVHKDSGLRRFRVAHWEIPRKSGKSCLSAGAGLYMFAEDGEFGAEVYSGATTEKQAWEVFRPARWMAKREVDFQKHYGVHVGAKNLSIAATHSRFEPLIGKPGDGASPHMAIVDEYHEHDTDEQLETMQTGMGAREQPMLWVITTAGDDTAGPCYALRSELISVLKGQVENEEFCGAIWTVDDGDAWDSEEALRKANPNMGVSVFADYLKRQQRDAINNPRKQSTFKRKHLNVWVGAADPFFDIEKWGALADPTLDINDFHGEDCFGGLDLSSKTDTTSDARLFRRVIDGEVHYYAFGRTYVPTERIHEPENRKYAGWAVQGHVVECGDARIDYDMIEDDIKGDADNFGLMLGVDPWNATQVITHMQKHMGEDRVVEIPQTVNHLSEPMKELDALIRDGRIHHTGNPAQTWMMDNVTAKEDHKGNVFPRKARPEKKIDYAVALMLAMNLALRHKPKPKSRWDDDSAEVPWV